MKSFNITRSLLPFVLMFFLSAAPFEAYCFPPQQQYYEIRTYHLKNTQQEKLIDQYLEKALLPALHRTGIKSIGVFKPIGNDTSSTPKIYMLIPYRSLKEFETVGSKLDQDKIYLREGVGYLNATYDNAPYERVEKTLVKAFSSMPVMQVPDLSSPRADRVYELRSYESATEKLHATKVKMFNTGDEIGLFKRLGFNAVFYGSVIAGATMPNLMYMTSFDNISSREEHWKVFRTDAQWKKLSSEKEYDHSVSKAIPYLLHPTEYSDF